MLNCCRGGNVTITFPETNISASFSSIFSYPKNGEDALRKGFEVFRSDVISNEKMWRLGKENPVPEQIKLLKWKWFAHTEKGFLCRRGTSFDLERPRRMYKRTQRRS
jgi:hypothetical protein